MSLDTDRLTKSARRLRSFLKKARKRPSPEEIHDFRTRSRRFEAMLEALTTNLKGNERRLMQTLARLRKRAGKIRDMDVLTGCASTVQVDGEQDCSVQLLEYLGAERYRQANKMRGLVRIYGPELRRRLRRTSAKLDRFLRQAEKNQLSAQAGAPTAMANALQLSSELGVPDRLNKQNIHAYRLKVKQLRYVLQMSDAANRQRFVDKLGEVKDAIGEWHDWDELISIATELLNHGRNCKFLRELKRVSKEKYESALLLANGMRRTYLPPRQTNVRAASKNEPRRGLARPVLVATSAIAD